MAESLEPLTPLESLSIEPLPKLDIQTSKANLKTLLTSKTLGVANKPIPTKSHETVKPKNKTLLKPISTKDKIFIILYIETLPKIISI